MGDDNKDKEIIDGAAGGDASEKKEERKVIKVDYQFKLPPFDAVDEESRGARPKPTPSKPLTDIEASLSMKINMQMNRFAMLENLVGEISMMVIKDTHLCDLESLQDAADTYWREFSTFHEKLCDCQPTAIANHPYMIEDFYGQALANHMNIIRNLGKIKALISKPATPTIITNTRSGVLCKITPPPFSGDYAEWKSFSDIFMSLIGSQPISPSEKLIRLKDLLKDDAEKLIKNLSVCDENYDIAWKALSSRYENRRLIIASHLNRILALKPLEKKSAEGLLSIINTTTESLDALRALKAPVETWDIIICHIIRRLLDESTREAWEVNLGDQTDPPTLSIFIEFLKARARALENVERGEHNVKASINCYQNSPKQKFNKGNSSATRSARVQQASGVVWNKSTQNKSREDPSVKACALCKQDHFLGPACSKFIEMKPQERRQVVEMERLCYNCLGPHKLHKCISQRRCRTCNEKHHTLLHHVKESIKILKNLCENQQSEKYQVGKATIRSVPGDPLSGGLHELVPIDNQLCLESSTSSTERQSEKHIINNIKNNHHGSSKNQLTILATARARALSPEGHEQLVRILIDQGSELSFITEHLVTQLSLQRQASKINIIGIGNTPSNATRGLVNVVIQSDLPYNQQIEITAHILPKLTAKIPPFSCKSSVMQQLKGMQLADKHFLVPGSIDILIGADHYGKIIGDRIKKFRENQLTAQSSILGWIVSGPICCDDCLPRSSLSVVRQTANQQLLEILKKFWVQEEITGTPSSGMTSEELECERHFQQTHTRDETGRYIVRLPFKSSPAALGESRSIANKFLQRMNRRLSVESPFSQLYVDFMKEYEELHHMKKAAKSSEPTSAFYLPHHGVLREDSHTTKLRVVFNGSSKTSSGISINDILHSGPKLQVNSSDVLIWFRKHRFVFGTDITKMFRQIKVHQDDWDHQRILWFDENQEICPYQLTTVTYGTNCAPWLALRVLQQLIEDEGHHYPKAVPALSQGRYVDDIYGGADEERELEEIIKETINLCTAGGFPLQKWCSNNPQTLSRLGISVKASSASSSAALFEESATKILGISWNPQTDTFKFSSKPFSNKTITKRVIISEIAQIYDPLGLISPVIVKAKILIQELWLLKVNWDDHLPMSYIKSWKTFREDFNQLEEITIPRWLNLSSSSDSIQLHGFADASNLAMGAAIYLRTSSPGSSPRVTLVCAKTKVAPLKKMTIPRLELTAAVILTELAQYVQQTLKLEGIETHLWSDSSVAINWIRGHPSRWKEFVQNRVQKIQDTQPSAHWRHINGTENPADCASRGLSPKQLAEHQLWWTGPPWLSSANDNWPVSSIETSTEVAIEERASNIQALPVQAIEADNLLQRYSSLTKLLKVSARIARACNRFARREVPESPVITPQEIEEARNFWLRYTQQLFFENEIEVIRRGEHLPAKHPMAKLTPFIDEKDILRIGGRLNHSNLDANEKHPAIIPKESRFTTLVIDDCHQRSHHGGPQLTLAHIRQQYWLVGGRIPVKNFIFKCVICTRYRARRAQQLMGQLPSRRVTPSRAFLHSGVDFAGPFNVLRWRGSGAGRVSYKAYISVFVCFATSAVHLELVTDYTSEGFIAAYKRFIARRGICSTITSDQGLNFTGAERELSTLFDQASQQFQSIASSLASHGTEWKFIPSRAPHFGGKWEAAVKSTKYHLRRIIGTSTLTYEEFTTLLCQVEAILNSRPLCPLTEDPLDVSALTPGHFLIGEPLTSLPEPNIMNINIQRLSRYQMITQKVQHFWERWHQECLQRYQAIYKWNHPSESIKVGMLVLISEDGIPPSRWALARVIEVRPGADQHTRVVQLKTAAQNITRSATQTVIRPIHKLIPLPLNIEEEQRTPEQHRDEQPERESSSESS